MDYLKTIESFVTVATLGSFSAAAEQLGMSRALITRHVIDLEDRLGTRLLNRSTRRIALTDIGAGYFEFARAMLAELRQAEMQARKGHKEPEGSISIIAPKSFGGLHFSKAVAEFALAHPKLRVNLILDDDATRSLHIAQSQFDVAIRLSPLQDKSAAIVRRIGSLDWILCAAPAYLTQISPPTIPADLSNLSCILHTTLAADRLWRFDGMKKGIKVSGTFLSNSVLAIRQAALAGIGIAQLPTYYIAHDLKKRKLVPVLKNYPLTPRPVYALLPANRLTPKRTELFVRFIAKWYSTRAWETADAETDGHP